MVDHEMVDGEMVDGDDMVDWVEGGGQRR